MQKYDEQSIYLRELLKLQNCSNQYVFDKLNLNSNDNHRYNFNKEALNKLKVLLLEKLSKEDCIKKILEFIESNYSPDWFAAKVPYLKNKEKDTTKILRLLNYIYDSGSKVMGINIPFNFTMPAFKLADQNFSSIHGKVDLVLQKGGQIEAIKFQQGEPEFSYRARKPRNIVENSLLLTSMMIGLSKNYNNLKVSIYYLKNKDDKGDNFPSFESKKGNNIISTNFPLLIEGKELNNEKIIEHFINVLNIPGDKDCSKCRYKDTCKFTPIFRYPMQLPHSLSNSKKTDYLSTLTDNQLQVVTHVDGPMNVIAIPGAGKTHSLVSRMEYLIKNKEVNAKNILFLTFSNKACGEILNRVSNALGEDEQLPHIYTFNGLGYQILRDNANYVGKLKLADETDRLVILGEVINIAPPLKGVSYDGLHTTYGLIRRCDRWISEIDSIGLEAFTKSHNKLDIEGIVAIRNLFYMRFKDAGFINYEDQIILCNKLFNENQDILNNYSKIYRYIMVDEFQDVDEEQSKLVYSIASHQNIVVVGDDDQSIYKFRGGSNKYMLEFASTFDKAKTVIMSDNFRSNNKIILASSALINKNTVRFHKDFITHKDADNKPLLIKHSNMDTILKYIAQVSKKVSNLGDIAIIATTNSTLIKLADYISPYFKVTSPKDYVIQDTVFILLKDLLSLYINKMSDDKALFRLAKFFSIDEKEFFKLDRSLTLYENLVSKGLLKNIELLQPDTFKAYQALVSKEECSPIIKFGYQVFQCLKEIQYSYDLKETLANLFEIWSDGNYSHPVLDFVFKAIDEKRIRNFQDLYTYFNNLVLFEDTSRVGYGASPDSINLLTAHDSKGKEFPVVFIYGIEDFKGKVIEEIEEERRLLFVAMTRAENNLAIFSLDGPPNQFLDDIKDEVRQIS